MAASDLADFLAWQNWDSFFTSTFKVRQRYSATAIDKVIRVLREPRLRPCKAFIAAEQHLLGGWHTHGLLEYPHSHWSESMDRFAATTLQALGYNMVSQTKNMQACATYLSKYITKDEFHGDWRMIGRKKFWDRGPWDIDTWWNMW